MFHVTWVGRGVVNVVGWVWGMKCAGKELRGQEGEVVAHWKNLGFCVKKVNGALLHAASCNAEGGVLEGLKFLNGCGRGVWELDGCGVEKKGPDQGLVV